MLATEIIMQTEIEIETENETRTKKKVKKAVKMKDCHGKRTISFICVRMSSS